MALRPGAGLRLLALFAYLVPGAAWAQHITIDGSLGTAARTLAGPNYAITASLGKQVGGNLFQSFGIFGPGTKESATFSGPASANNVIGRVPGGNLSSINDQIASTIKGRQSLSDQSERHRFWGECDRQRLTLRLVGGPVSITGGALKAPAGSIPCGRRRRGRRGAVRPAQHHRFGGEEFWSVNITGGSTLDVSNPITITAGETEIGGKGFPRYLSQILGAESVAAGNINIVAGRISINGN